MKVAFFHGLESQPRSEKNEILEELFGADNIYAPEMVYDYPLMYEEVLKHLQENPVDLLIGSSMGGYFAHSLSTILNIPTLLFNPAVHSRSMEPDFVETGNKRPVQTLVLGKADSVVKPYLTLDYFSDAEFPLQIDIVEMEHRVPAEIFREQLMISRVAL